MIYVYMPESAKGACSLKKKKKKIYLLKIGMQEKESLEKSWDLKKEQQKYLFCNHENLQHFR